MAHKYTYSETIGNQTFTAVEFDSFDEAVKAVELGIRDHLNRFTVAQGASGGHYEPVVVRTPGSGGGTTETQG